MQQASLTHEIHPYIIRKRAAAAALLVCLVLFLTAAAAVVPAHAQFQYDRADKTARQLSARAFEILPGAFGPMQKKLKVRVLPQRDIHRVVLYGKGEATGFYRRVPNTGGLFAETRAVLMIAGGRPFRDMLQTTLHEFAHHVYQEEITATDRRSWEELWAKEYRRSTLPTPYASTNASEGFAESFACWVLGPSKARPDSALKSAIAAFHSYKLSKESRVYFDSVKQYIADNYGISLPRRRHRPSSRK